VLAAADPAQPYGAVLPWPKRAGARRPAWPGPTSSCSAGGRRSSSSAAEVDGAAAGSRPRVAARRAGALVDHARRFSRKRLAVERFDGEPLSESRWLPLLVEAGFLAGPRRAVLRP
jgi:ATP-dependent Lhr-like helicase